MKEAIIFDLDGTLAQSKSAIDAEMGSLIEKLLEKKKILVMSGGQWRQFETQFLNHLKLPSDKLSNLFISPTSGSGLYRFENGEVHEMYADNLKREEKEKIHNAFVYALSKIPFNLPEKVYGERIEDRHTQITFSALGQEAPLSLKEKWDPDHKKREIIVKFLKEKIPEFEIHIGGTTSIDITKRGEGKDFGIREFSRRLNIPIENMVYVGDALFPGGNDEPAKKTGIDCIQVKNVEETKRVIREIIAK